MSRDEKDFARVLVVTITGVVMVLASVLLKVVFFPLLFVFSLTAHWLLFDLLRRMSGSSRVGRMKISQRWYPEERISVASALLGIVQKDIYAGSYGLPGRPNITSVQYVLGLEADKLNQDRASLETMLNEKM